MKTSKLFFSLIALTLLCGCASLSAEDSKGYVVEGRVIDVNTKKSLPDAVVVQRWSFEDGIREEALKLNPGLGWRPNYSGSCLTLQLIQTDADGRFKFNRPGFIAGIEADENVYVRYATSYTVLLPGYYAVTPNVVPSGGHFAERWRREHISIDLQRSATFEASLDSIPELTAELECLPRLNLVEQISQIRNAVFVRLYAMKVTPEALADAYARRDAKWLRKPIETISKETYLRVDSTPGMYKQFFDAQEKKK